MEDILYYGEVEVTEEVEPSALEQCQIETQRLAEQVEFLENARKLQGKYIETLKLYYATTWIFRMTEPVPEQPYLASPSDMVYFQAPTEKVVKKFVVIIRFYDHTTSVALDPKKDAKEIKSFLDQMETENKK